MNNYPIKQRNSQLYNLFSSLGYDVRLIGDRNQPKIIINNSFVVSGFVKNRLYNFTNKPFNGEIVRTINLNYLDITKEELDTILDTNEQRIFYKIKLRDTQLYYLKTEDNEPLFSVKDSRYFFDKSKANKTLTYLKESFNLNIYLETYQKS